MTFIYIFLIGISLLPLTIFLIKRKRYRKILTEGTAITAEVKNVVRRRSKTGYYDIAVFWYLPNGANQYQAGQLMTKPGKYRGGNTLEVFYLPEQPEKYAVPGSRYETWTIVFLLLFIAFVVFACFKIDEMAGDQKIIFNP